MRAMITLFIVLSCGAAAMVISSRASKAVDAKTGSGAAAAAALEVKAFTLELYAAGGAAHTVALTGSGLLKFSGDSQSLKLDDADRGALQSAFGAVPSRLWRDAPEGGADPYSAKQKAKGGDFYYVTLAGGRNVNARADGWRASDLDGIKAAIWRIIRRRKQPAIQTDPKQKTKKGVEFVEPFESLRNALRIKF